MAPLPAPDGFSCPRCRRPLEDPGIDPAAHVRCGACGHTTTRAALAAADPALCESISSQPTVPSSGAAHADARDPEPAAPARTAPRPFTAPRFGGAFEVLDVLGAGGMGVVYLARQRELDRLVAIKTLKGQGAPGSGSGSVDSKGVERFRREGVALARLSHPNVLAVYQTGEEEGTPFIVFEYVEGRSLKKLLAAAAPLTFEGVVEVTDRLLAGLEHAHQRGVMHRDLKPDNILLPSGGGLKIADFGLARLSGPAQGEKLTDTGDIMGTPNYMSPEQARGDKASFFSDIYAVGVILYEMITGRVPFTGHSVPEILVKHAHAPVPPMLERREGIPGALAEATMRALAKKPADRWESAGSFRKALAAC